MERKKGSWALFGALLALAGSACSCGEDAAKKLKPELAWNLADDPTGWADYLVDFGDVAIGAEAGHEITIQNRGSSPLVLSAHPPAPPFAMELVGGRLTVGVGESSPLRFVFAPEEASDRPIQVIITFATNEGGGEDTRTVRLTGRGVLPVLDCTPDPLDFGMVVKGSEKTSTLRCTNPSTTPLTLVVEGFKGNFRSAFAVTIEGSEGSSLLLPPEETATMQVRFRGDFLGANDATLVLRDENNQLLAQVEMLGQTMESSLQLEPAACLDFGYAPLGTSKRLSFLAHNIGSKDLEIHGFELAAQVTPSYRVVTETPLVLPAGGDPVEVEVEFQPAQGGALSTTIEVLAQDEAGESLRASGCATGFGGGPGLSCLPSSLDFGMVAVGIPASLQFRCLNDGHAPAGVTIDPLIIGEVASDEEAFSVVIRNDDGSAGPKVGGYVVGEGFSLEVVYAPASESFDEGTISVRSEALATGVLELGVSGQGRALPPCDFSVIPPQLRFGVVDRGMELELAFSIQNHQDTACLIHDLRLTNGSDPAFSVTPLSFYELEGLEVLHVPVTFAPSSYAPSITGGVQFQISNPDRREQLVPLHGASAEACIQMLPAIADFGMAEVGCNAREQVLRAQNVCNRPVSILGVEVEDLFGAEQFTISGRPPLPKRLEPRESVDLQVLFAPNTLGKVEGAISVQVQGATFEETLLYKSRLLGEGGTDAMQTDRFRQGDQPKVDILWVMDNSGSFEDYQARISENLPAFLTYANQNGIDWQIAVTTTGLDPIGDGCPGGARGGENGRFFPVDGSHPRILDRRTPGLAEHWSHNIKVGVCHADEFPYEAAKRALSEPLIGSEKDSRYPDSGYMDGNAGFLREGADLSIIFVTDERDHSVQTPAHYVNFFQNVKFRDDSIVRLHAITGPKESQGWQNCPPTEYGDRILAGVDATGGSWLNICTPVDDHEAWEEGLKRMSEGAFGFVSRFVLRGLPASVTPDPRVGTKDIELRIDGVVLQPTAGGNQVWTYDSIANAIDFTPFYTPPPGSEITVTYRVRCL